MRKPRFNRKVEFVFVRQTRLTSTVIAKPGDPLPEGTRLWRMRRLYDRGRIGMVGNAWTDEMLAHGSVAGSAGRARVLDNHARQMSGLSRVGWHNLSAVTRNLIKRMHTEMPEPEVDEDLDDVDQTPPVQEPVHVGGGWYEVEVDGEIQKVQGKEAAQALVQ